MANSVPQPDDAGKRVEPWDPYAEGRRIVAALKEAEGGALDQNEAAKLMGLTVRALTARAQRKKIVAWRDATGRYRYPRWQFIANGLLPGVSDCLRELNDSDQWAVLRFFLVPSEQARGRRPLDLIREERIGDAIEIARSQSFRA